MRTNANQREIPLDAPLDVVVACKSEADAVRRCLRIAFHRYGRDQKTVALLCGWQTDTCLSEIAKESNPRRLPKTRRARFAVATGCNLVGQYLARMEGEAARAGKPTERSQAEASALACMAAWGLAEAQREAA